MRLLLPFLLLAASPARAQAPSLYEQGHALRREGKLAEAKGVFLRMLEQDPESGGALEGLTLVSLRLGEAAAAAGYADRWWARSRSPYVAELRARAHERAGSPGAAQAALDWARLDPADERPRRAHDRLAGAGRGLFPQAYAYRSEVTEGLDTAAPQRIAYEGRGAGAELRLPLRRGLRSAAAYGVRQEAQLNETGGFPYFDLLERTPSLGLALDAGRGVTLEGRYARSEFSDVTSGSVPDASFDGGRARAAWDGAGRASASWTRAPKLARGTGASLFFAILRQDAYRADAGASVLGWDVDAGGGVDRYSEGTDNPWWSASAGRELGAHHAHLSWSRRHQEFYGADPATGKLRFVALDRAGARWRWRAREDLTLGAGAGVSWYEDSNRGEDYAASLSWDVPSVRGLALDYAFAGEGYRLAGRSYRAFDERSHRFGPRLRRGLGGGLWAELAWTRGVLTDDVRGTYDAQEWRASADLYRGEAVRVSAEGGLRDNEAGDDAWSGGVSMRLGF